MHKRQTYFLMRNLNDFSKVEDEYSEAKSIGDNTLVLLNATIQDIDRSLKCFNVSKQLAEDANRVANLAYRQVMNSSKVRPTTGNTKQAKKHACPRLRIAKLVLERITTFIEFKSNGICFTGAGCSKPV